MRRARPSLPLLLIAGLGLGGALGAGCYNMPERPVYGYEVDDVSCADGVDNDYDGLVDCADTDCLVLSHLCGEIVPEIPQDRPESGADADEALQNCSDDVDNDNDGQFDCGDQDCRDIPETCCIRENTNETCSDGIDNDSNGFADCEDFGCRNGIFVDVCNESSDATCDDGKDNDGDYGVDVVGDPGCGQLPNSIREDPACNDGLDNDGDGKVDYDGYGGFYAPDPQCTKPNKNQEVKSGCGIGFELMLLLPALIRLRTLRNRRGTD